MEDLLPFECIDRELIIRKKADTSDKFGMKPENRKAEELLKYGIVNIDKPKGPSSHQVSAYAQKILGLDKAGHSGTLDPGVTGVLPIGFGRATRIVQVLLTAGKEYVAIMRLHKDVPEHQIRESCAKFLGKIQQLPPVKSAVKRQLRERSIYYLEILEIKGRDVLFKVGCQAGTYIRKLIFDIGKEIGCGANMFELRRTKAGPFNESTLATLQDLTDAVYYFREGNEKLIRRVIQPPEAAVRHLPKVYVLDSAVDSLCHGANLHNPGISQLESGIEPENVVAVMSLKGELVCYGLAKLQSQGMLTDHGLAVKTEKVFMIPGTYPKIEKES